VVDESKHGRNFSDKMNSISITPANTACTGRLGFCAFIFVRRFKEQGRKRGSIINMSTDSAQTFSGQINYGASKAAIEAFTRSVAIEVGSLGIRVNTIAPGPTQTGYISLELEGELSERIPLKRIGSPEDIADVAIFLASEQARWVTGQVIKVSGGHAL